MQGIRHPDYTISWAKSCVPVYVTFLKIPFISTWVLKITGHLPKKVVELCMCGLQVLVNSNKAFLQKRYIFQ